MIKGYFWRSSVERVIRVILDQDWDPTVSFRDVQVMPVGTKMEDSGTPSICLSVLDRTEYRTDPSKLVNITNRVCIMLMREGYEIRNNAVIDRGPVDKLKVVEGWDEVSKAFGDPGNKGPKKK